MIVATMYSYKGGAGRTVCTANLVGSLARELGASMSNPIILLDMDLDSAGLTHLMEVYDEFENSTWNTAGLISGEFKLGRGLERDMFFNRDKKTRLASSSIRALSNAGLDSSILSLLKDLELRQGICIELERLTNANPGKVVERLSKVKKLSEVNVREALASVIPAVGATDVSAKVQAPQGSVLFVGGPQVGRDPVVDGDSRPYFRKFIEECRRQKASAVLIDSASGRQNIATLCQDLSDIVVYCCRLTYQFRVGTRYQLRQFITKPTKRDREKPAIIILPVAVPQTISAEWDSQKKRAMSDLTILSTEIGEYTPTYCFRDGVPEVELFKWEEDVLETRPTLAEDEAAAVGMFKLLAAKISELSRKRQALASAK
jgi:hypothetical protein